MHSGQPARRGLACAIADLSPRPCRTGDGRMTERVTAAKPESSATHSGRVHRGADDTNLLNGKPAWPVVSWGSVPRRAAASLQRKTLAGHRVWRVMPFSTPALSKPSKLWGFRHCSQLQRRL